MNALRNVAAVLAGVIAAFVAMQPFIWLHERYVAGRTFDGAAVVLMYAVGLLPWIVAAFAFGGVIALIARTSRPVAASVLTGAAMAAIYALEIWYVAPEVSAWIVTIADICIVGVIAAVAFRTALRLHV